MNRARVAFSATLVATTLVHRHGAGGPGCSGSADDVRPGGQEIHAADQGRSHHRVHRSRSPSARKTWWSPASPCGTPRSVRCRRLTVAETWYDKGGAIVTGGKGGINGLLQPGEIQVITIETPYNAKMNGNQFNFSHANGSVKPAKVAKLDAPQAEGAAAAKAAAKK